ncbi:hypothetical protein KRZ98_18195, partial [Sphingobium sp. AS12]|uniref:hypothetical protein n=1 Tax=Sphingobium sp. AS12 TaxID=2849495 RepID=UPI001C31A519
SQRPARYPPDRGKAGSAREKMGTADTPESLTGRVNATFRRRLHLYDMIVINTPDALLGVYPLDLAQHIPMVFYTHNENLVFRNEAFKGVFNATFDAFFVAAMRAEHLIIGTQTDRNKAELKAGQHNAVTLPMPMPERGLLERYEGEKSGLLFIGRWEERKNPSEFIRVAAATKLPVKVMTAKTSVKKWQDAFDGIGVKHDVRGNITGREKVDFIASSKVFYMPSKSQSYGFSLLEAAGHCHCVLLQDYGWKDNWDSSLYHATKALHAPALINSLHEQDVPPDNLAKVQANDAGCWSPWALTIANFPSRKSNSKAAKINEWDKGYVRDFIKTLNRFASTEDIISVLNNRHKFDISYTAEATWMQAK